MAWINLGRVLQKKGWSSTRFASELGIPPNRVSRYYRKDFDPPFSTVLRWAEVLGVSVQDLVDTNLKEKLIPPPQSTVDAILRSGIKPKGRGKMK
jgi:transcriptional regulator with XRE-family HTH domain